MSNAMQAVVDEAVYRTKWLLVVDERDRFNDQPVNFHERRFSSRGVIIFLVRQQ